MNTLTHALLPVVVAGTHERAYLGKSGRKGTLTNRDILFIGIAGAAPDLLDPHLALAARYTSWSHSILAWLGFTLLLGILVRWRGDVLHRRLVPWLSAAYLFHLFCDAIAGGLAWLYPLNPHFIVGRYLVSPSLWIPLDIICVISTYFLYRAIPRLRDVHAGGE